MVFISCSESAKWRKTDAFFRYPSIATPEIYLDLVVLLVSFVSADALVSVVLVSVVLVSVVLVSVVFSLSGVSSVISLPSSFSFSFGCCEESGWLFSAIFVVLVSVVLVSVVSSLELLLQPIKEYSSRIDRTILNIKLMIKPLKIGVRNLERRGGEGLNNCP